MTTDVASNTKKQSLLKSPLKSLLKYSLSFFKYLAIFAVIYLAVNWWRQPIMPATPQLQLTDYQGQTIDLAQMSQNRPTMVYFWGTWCGVCSVSSPKINTLAEQGYSVASIAVKSGDNTEIKQYMNEHGYHFTVVNDSDGEIFNNWQGQVTPSYVILNEGKMTQGLTGIQPLWSLKLRLWLSEVL